MSATWTRPDVARLLGIREWQLANFASIKYPYKLRPSERGAKGRGKKGRYNLPDVYKIAIAAQMQAIGQDARIIAETLRALFPKSADPMEICVKQRPKKFADVRYVVINYALAPWIDQSKLPEAWRGQNPDKQEWVSLWPRTALSKIWRKNLVLLRTVLIFPFDELLVDVDSRILGRRVGFERSWPKMPEILENEDG